MHQFLGNLHERAPNSPQDWYKQGKEQPLGKLHATTLRVRLGLELFVVLKMRAPSTLRDCQAPGMQGDYLFF